MGNNMKRTEKRLKEVLGDSIRLDLYYTALSAQNAACHKKSMIALLCFSLVAGVGEVANGFGDDMVAKFTTFLPLICFILIAFLSVVMLVYDFSSKAGIYRMIGEQCRDISRECIQLWHRQPLSDNTEGQISEFEIRLTNITKVEVKNNEVLNNECHEEAVNNVSRIQEAVG